jgi:K+-sensing histidine kinase KdpD
MGDRKLDSALGLVGALAADLLVTAALFAFREDVPSVVPFGLMLGICVATSWGSSVWSGIYAGVMGALFYDFFFTEPYGKVYIANVAERVLAAVLLASGALSAALGHAVQVFRHSRQGPPAKTWRV